MEQINNICDNMTININIDEEARQEVLSVLTQEEQTKLLESNLSEFEIYFYQLKFGTLRKDKNGDFVFICSLDDFIIHEPTETEKGRFLLEEFDWDVEILDYYTTEDIYDIDNKNVYAAYLPNNENKIDLEPIEKILYKIFVCLADIYGADDIIDYPLEDYLNDHALSYFGEQ